MRKSKVKRVIAPAVTLAAALAAALGVYVYPRRTVPAMETLVPPERLILCVRVRNLGPLWRECAATDFGRKVGRGEIFPIAGLRERDARFDKEWNRLDTSFWPEALGRDCLVALYCEGEGGRLRVAAWSRVGFRTRVLYLWERLRGAFSFGGVRRQAERSEGGLRVVTRLDRRRGTGDFSYALLGDLGIATTGPGERFWREVAALAKTLPGGPSPPVRLPEPRVPRDREAAGTLFIDASAMRAALDGCLASPAGNAPARGAASRDALEIARRMCRDWERATGFFTLGGRSGGEVAITLRRGVGEGGQLPPRDAPADPLWNLMERRGLAYGGFRADLRGIAARARDASGAGLVEFLRPEGPTFFNAAHFSLSWLGDDCSALVYEDGKGMVHAAVSARLRDRRLAAQRLSRFLALADHAKICVLDSGGEKIACTGSELRVEEKRRGGSVVYRFLPEGWIRRFYLPTLLIRGERMVFSTSAAITGDLEQKSPGARSKAMQPGRVQFRVRGSETAQAAQVMQQVLMLVTPFMEAGAGRAGLQAARETLGAFEWLAPVREAWAVETRGAGTATIRFGADFNTKTF